MLPVARSIEESVPAEVPQHEAGLGGYKELGFISIKISFSFFEQCIDNWIQLNNNCAFCSTEVLI